MQNKRKYQTPSYKIRSPENCTNEKRLQIVFLSQSKIISQIQLKQFFFFIGKKNFINQGYFIQGEWSSKNIFKQTRKKANYVQIRREAKNNGMKSLEVNPQERDQSNSVPVNNAMSWSTKCSWSSKMQPLCSLQIIHIFELIASIP